MSVRTDEPVGDSTDQRNESLIVAGQTCWRSAPADRYADIVDGADYLRHIKAAMLNAHHRIVIIGWDLDTGRHSSEARPPCRAQPTRALPHWLLWKRPDSRSTPEIEPATAARFRRVLVRHHAGQSAQPIHRGKRMHFAVDGVHPTGAVHHQKIVVVDDAVAFCGGIDLTIGRWDTRAHLAVDPRRTGPGDPYGPRHEVAAAMDGAAAQVLAEQAQERWQAATGQTLDKDVPFAHPAGPAASSLAARRRGGDGAHTSQRCPRATRSERSRRWTSLPSLPLVTPSIWRTSTSRRGASRKRSLRDCRRARARKW